MYVVNKLLKSLAIRNISIKQNRNLCSIIINNEAKKIQNISCINMTIRNFGISDSIMSFASKKMENKKENQFKDMITTMVKSPKWTLRVWRATMTDQLGSWTMYVPGVSSSEEVKEIKNFKVILDAMTDTELDNYELVNGIVRERLARVSGRPPQEVAKLIFFYKQSLVVSTWLNKKKECKELLPESEFEMQEMQETDIRMRDIARKIMSPKGKVKSGRGKGSPFN
jgi:signal recognition particle GTPase